MQIAQVLAGYTLGGADLLRRAMGKKKPEEMAKQRAGFVDGAVERGVDADRAAWIFDLMEKFAGYGFNKSHSAAYALLVVPDRVAQGALPGRVHGRGAVGGHGPHRQGRHAHRRVQPAWVSTIAAAGRQRVAARVHRGRRPHDPLRPRRHQGVGEGAVQAIVDERAARGPFRSIEDLCRRLDLTRLNRRVLEALIRSGSLDGLGPNRASLMQRLGAAMQARRTARARVGRGPGRLVRRGTGRARRGAGGAGAAGGRRSGRGAAPGRASARRSACTSPAIRSSVSARSCRGSSPARSADLGSERAPQAGEGGRFYGGRQATVAGLVLEIRKRGGRTSFVLDDRTGRIEVTLFDETFQQYRDLIAAMPWCWSTAACASTNSATRGGIAAKRDPVARSACASSRRRRLRAHAGRRHAASCAGGDRRAARADPGALPAGRVRSADPRASRREARLRGAAGRRTWTVQADAAR